MATKTYTISDFTQSSSWVVAWNYGTQSYYVTSGPSVAETNKSVTFSGIPEGSIINSATLTASYTTLNYKKRTLDGTTFTGSRNVKAKVTVGGTASFEFIWQGSGTTSMGAGSFNSPVTYSNMKIVVDYTLPASGLTLNKTSCKAGDTIRCTITPASTSMTHKVKFVMGGVTKYASATIPAGTKIHDYTVPKAWQGDFGNSSSKTITVTLLTYSGSTNTGDVDKTFSLTLSDDAYPTIGTFNITRIPGFADAAILGYVQGFSQARVQSAATGAYSSTISQYKVTVGGWSGTGADVTSPVISGSGNVTVTLEVTDNRGRKKTQTQTITVLPYEPPDLVSPSVYRSNALGAAAVAGTSVRIYTGISISPLGGDPDVNVGVLKARVYQKGTTAPLWNDASVVALIANTETIINGMDISKSYTIDIQATDKLGVYEYTAEITTAKALISSLADVSGVAIGKYAEIQNTLEIAFDSGWLGSNPIATYRIGSLFFTFEDESPADLFPGTYWEKLTAGRFLVAGNTTGSYIPDHGTYGTGGAPTTHADIFSAGAHMYMDSTSGIRFAQWNYNQEWTSSTRLSATGTVRASDTSYTGRISMRVTGATNDFSIMPPWVAVYIWRRTA